MARMLREDLQRLAPGSGVYMVQLLARSKKVKSVRTRDIMARRRSLRHTYGPLRNLLFFPEHDPQLLEQNLHARFVKYRLYEGANGTELFALTSLRAQELLEKVLREYAAYCIDAPVWQRHAHGTDPRQGLLFSPSYADEVLLKPEVSQGPRSFQTERQDMHTLMWELKQLCDRVHEGSHRYRH